MDAYNSICRLINIKYFNIIHDFNLTATNDE